MLLQCYYDFGLTHRELVLHTIHCECFESLLMIVFEHHLSKESCRCSTLLIRAFPGEMALLCHMSNCLSQTKLGELVKINCLRPRVVSKSDDVQIIAHNCFTGFFSFDSSHSDYNESIYAQL